ncbi:hypothetical protein RclHR1_10890003 [Rhizophagus clarus]|uniref:Large ribosomal subunit protein uL30m n=1 Tax=Rhizophagus clarus TaxID=94130 RepID=A0A2Z6QVM6_9GLOM|nr:hypothetical protein RclHR1_10890003 [Rhizophagus clarus]GES82712.1 ribosomal protein l30 [Rhizophagus clarus]
MNSLTKLFLSQSCVASKYFSRSFFIPPTSIKANSKSVSQISHQNSTKIPNGFYKITLRRSTIGLPLKLRKVVRALGLRRLQQSVYHSQTAYIAGMILKVKEILQVNNVKRIPSPEERKRAEKGYVIIKKHNSNL